MNFCILFLVSLFFGVAGADDAKTYPIESLPDNLRPSPEAMRLLKEGVQFISTQTDRAFATCTGQFISTHGDFLTAAHCVRNATLVHSELPLMNALGYIPFNDDLLGKEYKMVRRSSIKFSATTLEKMAIGTKNDEGFSGNDFTNLTLVAIGRGFSTNRLPPLFGHYSEQEFDEIGSYLQDFVILKVAEQTPQGTPCLRLAEADAKSADPVWIAGYGSGLDVGPGYIADAPGSDYPPEVVSNWRRFEDRTAIQFPQTPGKPGMSGGPMINREGEIVGVVMGGGKASAITTRASAIRREVENQAGIAAAKNVFDCR